MSQKTGALAMKPGGDTALSPMNTRCTGVPATYATLSMGPKTGWFASGCVVMGCSWSRGPNQSWLVPLSMTVSAIFVWSALNASPRIEPGTLTGTGVALGPCTTRKGE